MYETRDLSYHVLDHRLRGRWSRLFRRLHQLSRQAADAGDADTAQRYRLLAHQFRPLTFRSPPHDAAVVLDHRLRALRRQLQAVDACALHQVEHDAARLKQSLTPPNG